MRAHDRRVEHLDEMRGRTHRGERVEEGFEDASLAQSVEAFPYAVARTEAFRQGAPPNILDREEVERFEETAIVAGLPPASWKAGAKPCERERPILLAHFCRHDGFTSGMQKSHPTQIRPHGLAICRAVVSRRILKLLRKNRLGKGCIAGEGTRPSHV
jgi:hypothetical protein